MPQVRPAYPPPPPSFLFLSSSFFCPAAPSGAVGPAVGGGLCVNDVHGNAGGELFIPAGGVNYFMSVVRCCPTRCARLAGGLAGGRAGGRPPAPTSPASGARRRCSATTAARGTPAARSGRSQLKPCTLASTCIHCRSLISGSCIWSSFITFGCECTCSLICTTTPSGKWLVDSLSFGRKSRRFDFESMSIRSPFLYGTLAPDTAMCVPQTCTEKKLFVPTIKTFLSSYFVARIGILGCRNRSVD